MIYEVVLSQAFFGQVCINRFNYVSAGTPTGITGAAALLTAMGLIDVAGDFPAGTIGAKLQAFVPTDVVYVGALSKAIREAPTDFYDYPYPAGVTGAATGDVPLSPTQAYGFYTNRLRTDVARGTKRFVGVTEGRNQSGGTLTGDTLTYLNELAVLLSETLSYTAGGNSLTFTPAVCGKKEYTTPRGKRAYEYWPTITEQLAHSAVGVTWFPYDTVRSQVSRQYKHGA